MISFSFSLKIINIPDLDRHQIEVQCPVCLLHMWVNLGEFRRRDFRNLPRLPREHSSRGSLRSSSSICAGLRADAERNGKIAMDPQVIQRTRYVLRARFRRTQTCPLGLFPSACKQLVSWLENHPVLSSPVSRLASLGIEPRQQIDKIIADAVAGRPGWGDSTPPPL